MYFAAPKRICTFFFVVLYHISSLNHVSSLIYVAYLMIAHARAYIIGVDFALWAKKHVRKPKKVSMD